MKVPFLDLRVAYQELATEFDEAYHRVMRGGHYVLGPELEAFEAEFASYCGAKHCIGVGSGTEALVLSLQAFGIGPGDEVITVPNTFIATALAIEQAGATTVLVDIDRELFTLDPRQLEASISPRTRAIMPVHLYGKCADMTPIMDIAKRHGLIVIEDAAQAHGALYRGQRAGAIGHAGCFSFYPTKNLGAFGQGGAVVTNDEKIAHGLRMLRNYGQREKYYHDTIGYNSRLDDLQAAFLRVSLRQLDRWNAARRERANWYDTVLKARDVHVPADSKDGSHVYHLYVVRTSNRTALQDHLRSAGIDTLVHYPVPIHRQQAFRNYAFGRSTHVIAEASAAEVLSLPMHPWLTRDAVEFVGHAMAAFEAV